MTDINILWIALIMYIISVVLALKYDKRIIMFSAILWFVPIFLIQNTIITVFSAIMLLLHVVMGGFLESEDDF